MINYGGKFTWIADRHGGTVPQPGAGQRHPGHEIYPYLLRKLAITRTNQVRALGYQTTSPWREGLSTSLP